MASPERDRAMDEIEQIHSRLANTQSAADVHEDKSEFAMPFSTQLKAVTIRTFQHYYRSPVYIGGKFVLSVLSSLFIGFTFYMEDNSVQGFQNKLFAVFFTTTIGTALINQIQPRFFFLRDLYEIRERPSKIYHWLSFLIAAVLAEIPWNLFMGTLFYFGWYFPVGISLFLPGSHVRLLEGCFDTSRSCGLSMVIYDGLDAFRQHVRAVHLRFCISPSQISNSLDAECAHGSHDHVSDVLVDIDLRWCLPTSFKFDTVLALDVTLASILLISGITFLRCNTWSVRLSLMLCMT